jgi:hypothetical protein
VPLAQGGLYLFLHREISCFPQAECLGHGRQDAGGVADRGERHEADAIGEVGAHHARDLQGQARFANAPSAGNGEQAHLWTREQLADRLHLLFAPDQGREWHRETGKPGFRANCFVGFLCS